MAKGCRGEINGKLESLWSIKEEMGQKLGYKNELWYFTLHITDSN